MAFRFLAQTTSLFMDVASKAKLAIRRVKAYPVSWLLLIALGDGKHLFAFPDSDDHVSPLTGNDTIAVVASDAEEGRR